MAETEEKEKPDAVAELLRQHGLQEGKYIITLTKQLKIEPIVPTISIEQVMPYPLSEERGLCPICGDDYKLHNHLDYFVKPKHVKVVRNFLSYLKETLATCKIMYFKLCTETSDTVLNPKETIMLLKDLAEKNPEFANQFIPIFSHYSPHELMKYEVEIGVERQRFEIEVHYNQLCRKYQIELELHRRLLGLELKKEKEALEELIKKHEHNAKIDYITIQADLHRITSQILGYEKLFTKFMEEPRYAKIKRALAKKERAVVPYEFYPPLRRRRPVRI